MTKDTLIILGLTLLTSTSFAKPALPETNTKPSINCLALTFDDGPSPVYTPQVLKILKKYNIKATFFIMGVNAKRYPELVKQIKNAGHVIANHSWNHPKLTKISKKELARQVNKTSNILYKITGDRPKCLRPPFGIKNKRVVNYVNSQGMHVIMWDLMSMDYKRKGTEWLVNFVLKNTKKGGDVIFHDGGKGRGQMIKALPLIIEGALKRGNCFETICG